MEKVTSDEFFINEDNNGHGLVNVQLLIDKSADRDDVIGKLMISLNKSAEIFENVKVNQIYFKGTDINQSIDRFKEELKKSVINQIDNIKF